MLIERAKEEPLASILNIIFPKRKYWHGLGGFKFLFMQLLLTEELLLQIANIG